MYDYLQQVEEFLNANFNPDSCYGPNVKMTTAELLSFLFKTFPKDCISDYELNDIMVKLKYERTTYSIEIDGKLEIKSGWCLFYAVMHQEPKVKLVESE